MASFPVAVPWITHGFAPFAMNRPQEALAEFKRRKDIAEANAEARSRRASFTPSFADFSLAEEAEEDRAAASGPKHGVMTLEGRSSPDALVAVGLFLPGRLIVRAI